MRAGVFSFIYRATRSIVTKILYFFQAISFRSKDLEPAVNFGDSQLAGFEIFSKLIYDFKIPSEKSVKIFDLIFPSPLIAASFKSDPVILRIWLKMGLGGIMLKTIMAEPRQGNPRPRLQDASIAGEKGILNTMGLPGDGIETLKNVLTKSDLWNFNRPIGISIGGDSLAEYIECIKTFDSVLNDPKQNYFYELNISCPNTENGLTIAEEPNKLEAVLNEARSLSSSPISVKISPDLSDSQLRVIGDICDSVNSTMINAGNTQSKKPYQVGVNPDNFSMPAGGFSGPALFDRTLEMVKLFSDFKFPIIATGGISKFDHVYKLKEAGACLFGMATSLVLDPYCIPKINSKI